MKLKTVFKIISLFFLPLSVLADQPLGLGTVAQNVMEPVTLFSDFIDTGCLLVGSLFIFASVIKYFEHRRSPLMVPISTVIFLLIAGLILVALPFVSYLTSSGVPYRLFN